MSWSQSYKDEALEMLQALVGTKSTSGDEGNIANVLNGWLRGSGLPTSMQPVRENTSNVIVEIGSDEPRLIFATHTDTVVPDPSKWSVTSPYEPKVIGDKVFGVGASDAKGVVVSIALALRRLNESYQKQWNGTVMGAFVTEEETTGYGCSVFANSLSDVETTMAVIGEPTRLEHISIGNRGNAFVKLTIDGRERHGAYPPDRYDSFAALERLKSFVNQFCDDFRDGDSVPSVTVTSIHGGVVYKDGELCVRSPNSAPGRIEITLDIRTTPKLESDNFRELFAVWNSFAESLSPLIVSVEAIEPPIPGQFIDPSHRIVGAAKSAIRTVTGNIAETRFAVGANDATFFDQRGIPTLNEVGPGDFALAHRPDEHVDIQQVLLGAEMYASIAEQLLSP